MTIQDGIILGGDRIVIPKGMRREMLKKVHEGHLGMNSCVRRARDVVFWPGMSSELRQFVDACYICISMPAKQSQAPLIMHPTPQRPWQKVGANLMMVQGR